MNKEPYQVGVFHKEESSRKAVIKLISSEFDCIEIEKWEDVASATAHTVVIVAPEKLYPKVSYEDISEVIENLRSNVIMVNYCDKRWWIFRTNYKQLKRPTEEWLKYNIRAFIPNVRRTKITFENKQKAQYE